MQIIFIYLEKSFFEVDNISDLYGFFRQKKTHIVKPILSSLHLDFKIACSNINNAYSL